MFLALREGGLTADAALQGSVVVWLAMDGAMTKAPLGGKRGKSSTGYGKIDTKRSGFTVHIRTRSEAATAIQQKAGGYSASAGGGATT